ncbi:MAG: DNA translocase FtsK 4TM domain-containing protein, partial [Actinomycetota bacterium]
MPKKKGLTKGVKLTDAQVRDIYAIVLAALALFSSLSLLGYGGVLGEYLAQALRLAVGIGSYLVPVLLVVWALLLFIERWRKMYLSRGAGITAVLISFISIVHLSSISVDNPATAFNPGTVMTYGGYIGAVVSYAFVRLAGKAGAYIILSSALLVGIVVMAGISLGDYLTEAIAQGRRGLAQTKRRTRSAQLPKAETSNQAMDASDQQETPADDRLAETIRMEKTKILAGQEETPVEGVKDKQYVFPPLDLLKMSSPKSDKAWKKSANEQIKVIEETLRD